MEVEVQRCEEFARPLAERLWASRNMLGGTRWHTFWDHVEQLGQSVTPQSWRWPNRMEAFVALVGPP